MQRHGGVGLHLPNTCFVLWNGTARHHYPVLIVHLLLTPNALVLRPNDRMMEGVISAISYHCGLKPLRYIVYVLKPT